MAKVKLISKVPQNVYIEDQMNNIRYTFRGIGSSMNVEKDILEQMMYDPGIAYMIENGILYIEDMEVKKELGIEPEDATEPVNVIVLSDADRKRYMTNMPLFDFKEKVKALKYEQLQQLADYAVANRLADIDKCKIIKELCGRDIIKTIQLHDANEEEDK